MHRTKQMERFSIAYIAAVASVAGFDLSFPPVDDDSIDGQLISRGIGRARLEFQAKASSTCDLADNSFSFDLPRKNYDDLRLGADDLIVPRVLFVVRMPVETDQWTEHSEEQMILKHCGYWVSLAGMPEIANQETKRIVVPRQNQLSPDSLASLMTLISQGRPL